ncbi:hypothetical protein [Mycolicibacterium palauense]|uniref:hypothetical protein n=1 Tax=Mycolicibacterium palauense TaxID=2034511 RepID=UPI001C3F3810|nr:hypothetical protein [Mycolicibacterium palauense]
MTTPSPRGRTRSRPGSRRRKTANKQRRQMLLVFTGSTSERFEQFHRDNPHVYRALVRLAREWVNRTGQRRLGIKTLYERARWDIAAEGGTPDHRLNNDFTAFYARLIMRQESDLDGVFALRFSEADQWIDEYAPRSKAAAS